MGVSLSFIPRYSKLRASLYTLNTANVWPMWESVGSSPPNYSPICPSPCQSWYICTAASRYSKPGLYTVTQSVSSYFLTDRNFSLIPKLLLLLILFQVMFFSFHTHMCPKENLLGESRQKEEERNSSSLFPLNTRALWLFPDPSRLDDFQMFWLGEHLQFSMRLNTLVVAGNSLFALLNFPRKFPGTGSRQSSRDALYTR